MAALAALVPEVLMLSRQGPMTHWGPFLRYRGMVLSHKVRQDPWGPHDTCTASPSSKVSQKQIPVQALREETIRSGGPDRPWPQMSLAFLVLLFGDHGHCHGAGELGLPAMGQAGNLH